MTNASFAEHLALKIAAIKAGDAPNRLNPFEFLQHILNIHKEGDQIKPIPRKTLCAALDCREHYLSEVISDYSDGDILPWRFAVGLANLTGTHPFYWLKKSYSLEEASPILIDLDKHFTLPNSHSHMVKQDSRASKIVRMMFEGSEEKLNPSEFIQYLFDIQKASGNYYPLSPRTLVLSTNIVRATNSPLSAKQAACMANITSQKDLSFWQKLDYTLNDAEGIIVDPTKIEAHLTGMRRAP